MSLISNAFWWFVIASVIIYYLVPKKLQWILLLCFSYFYYISGNAKYLFFILYSTIVTYSCGRIIDQMQEAGEEKKKLKRVITIGLIMNLGMLGIIKYTNFFIDNLNVIFPVNIPQLAVLFPLGISFYTFQSSSYMLDVYWKRIRAEKNFFKYALFVSFFPQLIQGPIAKWDTLGSQLYVPHDFDWNNIVRGSERIIWGLAKKMIISDWAGIFVNAIYSNPDRYSGVALIGCFLYGIQLYTDFSGAIDVVIGIGNLLGIDMDENFRRPYLATSMSNFWKRWHMTLGRWMENYVFYPICLSGWNKKFIRWSKKKYGRKLGKVIPSALADIIVFLLVGIWHGAGWKYVVYGLMNGGVIAFSELMGGQYSVWKKTLHITGKETWYHLFTILRTYILVNLRWLIGHADDLSSGLHFSRLAFTHFDPGQLLEIPAGTGGTAFTPYALLIIALGCIIMVTVGCIQEKGIAIRASLNRMPVIVPLLIYLLLFIAIGLFGSTAAPKGFIYAQF